MRPKIMSARIRRMIFITDQGALPLALPVTPLTM
jgi:hypothetical protein